MTDLDCSRIILPIVEVSCGEQCESSLVAIPVGGDSGLGSGGSDDTGEKLLHGVKIHSEVRPSRICL